MDSIDAALILLLAVVAGGLLSRVSPLPLPRSLVQIALGAAITSFADLGIELRPGVFFLLFLPPLLFLDAWRIPKEGLFRDKGTILQLVLGLVVFTVVGVGFFVNWMIPAMPLAVAFALAAIISPTDAVALSGITARAPIPNRLMHILEGEALLNDASGLVCMRFAIVAAVTGTFSLIDAFGTFLWLSVGGIAIGVAVTWSVTRSKDWVSQRIGEETGTQILITLLIPFGCYLLAEHLHCSGILAAVGAGITMSYAEQRGGAVALTRVKRAAFWDTIQFAANGTIFVLLGEQFPKIVAGAAQVVRETGHREAVWLIVYVFAITAALAVLRFLWVWISLQFMMFQQAREKKPMRKPSWRLIAVTSLAGVRGAITLAGVLTLPLAVADGSPFPARDLAIFLAAGVIIVSLVAASVGLPVLLKGLVLPPGPSQQEEEDQARVMAAKAAMTAVERAQHDFAEGSGDADIYADAGARIMAVYRERIERGSKTGDEAQLLRKIDRIERELRLAGMRAERDTFYRLARQRLLPDEMVRKLVRELDLLEARYSGG